MAETVGLLGVSVVSNGVALGLFALVRHWRPDNTPDAQRFARLGWAYVTPRSGYILLWGVGILLVSCVIAYGLADIQKLKPIARLFTPVIRDESAWYYVLERKPVVEDGKTCYQYARCVLEDGTSIAGRVQYYSTDTEETPDRDIALTDPLVATDGDGGPIEMENTIVIVSARQIRWLAIDWRLDTSCDEAAPSFGTAQT